MNVSPVVLKLILVEVSWDRLDGSLGLGGVGVAVVEDSPPAGARDLEIEVAASPVVLN